MFDIAKTVLGGVRLLKQDMLILWLVLIVCFGTLVGCSGGRDLASSSLGETGVADLSLHQSQTPSADAVKLSHRRKHRDKKKKTGKRNKRNKPPQILSAQVSPTQLEFFGGRVSITAQVTDRNGNALTVTAEVARQGQPTTVNLAPASSNTFLGEFIAPVNRSEQPVTYDVLIRATDGQNKPNRPVRRSAGQFHVNGSSSPPPPPPPPF